MNAYCIRICYKKKMRGFEIMRIRTVLDGNAFYEIDEDCLMQKQIKKEVQQQMKSKTDEQTGKVDRNEEAEKKKRK